MLAPSPAARLYAAFITVVIVVILGAQAVIGFTYHHSATWPILSYPMYSGAVREGDHLREYRLFAEIGSGERIALNAKDFGYSYWIFRKNIHSGVRRGGVPPAFVEAVCARHGPGVRDLVLENTGFFITRTGAKEGPPQELGRIAAACAGQELDQ